MTKINPYSIIYKTLNIRTERENTCSHLAENLGATWRAAKRRGRGRFLPHNNKHIHKTDKTLIPNSHQCFRQLRIKRDLRKANKVSAKASTKHKKTKEMGSQRTQPLQPISSQHSNYSREVRIQRQNLEKLEPKTKPKVTRGRKLQSKVWINILPSIRRETNFELMDSWKVGAGDRSRSGHDVATDSLQWVRF